MDQDQINIYGNIKYELNNNINGKGKEYYDGKLIFEGEYLIDKKWNGKGYDSLENIIYELKDEKGIIKKHDYFADKSKFEGEYLNEKRNGIGKDYWSNGILQFEGEYLNGKKNGKGKSFNDYGKLLFEGEYIYGNNLKGKLFINEKLEYEGEYL